MKDNEIEEYTRASVGLLPFEKVLQANIDAAYPKDPRDRHELYVMAVELVSARHAKAELVALVNYLLRRIDDLEINLEATTKDRDVWAEGG